MSKKKSSKRKQREKQRGRGDRARKKKKPDKEILKKRKRDCCFYLFIDLCLLVIYSKTKREKGEINESKNRATNLSE